MRAEHCVDGPLCVTDSVDPCLAGTSSFRNFRCTVVFWLALLLGDKARVVRCGVAVVADFAAETVSFPAPWCACRGRIDKDCYNRSIKWRDHSLSPEVNAVLEDMALQRSTQGSAPGSDSIAPPTNDRPSNSLRGGDYMGETKFRSPHSTSADNVSGAGGTTGAWGKSVGSYDDFIKGKLPVPPHLFAR